MLFQLLISVSFLLIQIQCVAIPQGGRPNPSGERDSCPNADSFPTSGTFTHWTPQADASQLPTFDKILIPTDAWLQQVGLANTNGDPDPAIDPNADPSPPDRRKRASPLHPTPSRALHPRTPTRDFSAPNYRQTALHAGLVVINGAATATGGTLINIVQFAAQLAPSLWHGDHKFELGLLKRFLTATPMRPGYDRWNYPSLWRAILRCPRVTQRVTDILNAPGNLIGLAADINLLKAILLQRRGPRAWERWDPVLVGATWHYLEFIREDYLRVAGLLGELVNELAGLHGQDAGSVGSPGKTFVDWARGLLEYASAVCENRGVQGALGPGANHRVLELRA